jgi:hypothetical protein
MRAGFVAAEGESVVLASDWPWPTINLCVPPSDTALCRAISPLLCPRRPCASIALPWVIRSSASVREPGELRQRKWMGIQYRH